MYTETSVSEDKNISQTDQKSYIKLSLNNVSVCRHEFGSYINVKVQDISKDTNTCVNKRANINVQHSSMFYRCGVGLSTSSI